MENPIKEGILHIQQQKFGIKVWKKNWSILYSASSSSIARLEQFDVKDFNNPFDRLNPKKLERIIRLSDCISISQNQVENSPKDMSTFCITTTEKTYIMAAVKYEVTVWIKCLCELAFQNTSARKHNEDVSVSSGTMPRDSLIMEENELYSTIPQAVNQFTVKIQKTEAATRCNLQGTYLLIPGKDSLILKDSTTKQDVCKWPYQYLRRYGKDQTTFTFEAGRRCDSGPGHFVFNTREVREIFHSIEAAVKVKESNTKERRSSLISVGSESSTTFSQQLQNAVTSQESLNDKLPGGRMPVSKNVQDTETNPKTTKIIKNQDWKGQASIYEVVPSVATREEKNIPTASERVGAKVPVEIVYATVKHSKGQSKKGKVEESTINPAKYRDCYSDDSSIDPVYENVSDIESWPSFDEEPTFLKDIGGPIYQNSMESHEDQDIVFPLPVTVSDYANVKNESPQTAQDDQIEDTPANKELELYQTPPGTKNKERDISFNPGNLKVTKAKFPALFHEMIDEMYSKELSKKREGMSERAGRSSELQKK
ncbi:uncharacterized protein [Scyliorhinus torazame]